MLDCLPLVICSVYYLTYLYIFPTKFINITDTSILKIGNTFLLELRKDNYSDLKVFLILNFHLFQNFGSAY